MKFWMTSPVEVFPRIFRSPRKVFSFNIFTFLGLLTVKCTIIRKQRWFSSAHLHVSERVLHSPSYHLEQSSLRVCEVVLMECGSDDLIKPLPEDDENDSSREMNWKLSRVSQHLNFVELEKSLSNWSSSW